MSALVIDFAATADVYRAAKATGQQVAPGAAMPIRVGIGDYVFDFANKLAGTITHFNHRDGQTKAVIQAPGCSFAANLPDLIPANRPKEFN